MKNKEKLTLAQQYSKKETVKTALNNVRHSRVSKSTV